MSKVFICAGNLPQARLCASQNYLDNFDYLNNLDQIRGFDNPKIWFTGSYFMNKTSKQIAEYCNSKRIPIILKELK